MRVLVANEPRAYREVIAHMFISLRPHVEVTIAAPATLDGELARVVPHLVICSQLTPMVQSRAHTWVILYPEGARSVVIGFAGEQTSAIDIELDELLDLIDQTERRVTQTERREYHI